MQGITALIPTLLKDCPALYARNSKTRHAYILTRCACIDYTEGLGLHKPVLPQYEHKDMSKVGIWCSRSITKENKEGSEKLQRI